MILTLPFVNRTEELEFFGNALLEGKSTSARVRVYHGKSGAGKSTLFREIAKRAQGTEFAFANPVVGQLDFDPRNLPVADKMLLRLRNSYASRGVDFSIFDFAVLLNWSVNYNDEAVPPLNDSMLARVVGEGMDDTAVALANEGFENLTKELLNGIIEEVPLAKFLFRQGRRWLIHRARLRLLSDLKEHMNIFHESDGKTRKGAHELGSLLVPSFLIDLNRHLTANPDSRLVLLIDHFEGIFLGEGARDATLQSAHLGMVKDIVTGIPDATVCLFCRELSIFNTDLFWQNQVNYKSKMVSGLTREHARIAIETYINQHKKGKLQLPVSIDVLLDHSVDGGSSTKPISSERLLEDVHHIDPMKLTWLIDGLIKDPEIFERGFGEVSDEIDKSLLSKVAERRLQNLDSSAASMIRCLHLLDGFPLEFWEQADVRNEYGLTPILIHNVKNLSITVIEDDRLFLDPATRKGIRQLMVADELDFLVKLTLEALDKYLMHLANENRSEDYLFAFQKSVELRREYLMNVDITWAETASDPLFEAGLYDPLSAIWTGLMKDFGVSEDRPSLELSMCLSQLGTCKRRTGRHLQAIKLFAKALVGRNGGPRMGLREAQIRCNYGESLRALERYDEAIDALRAANEFESDRSYKQTEVKSQIVANLAVAHLEAGDAQSARECIENGLHLFRTRLDDKYPNAVFHQILGSLMFDEGDIQGALEQYGMSLECWSERPAEHSVATARAYMAVAHIHSSQNAWAKALANYEYAIAQYEAFYVGPHSELADAYFCASQMLDEMEDPEAVLRGQAALTIAGDLFNEEEKNIEFMADHLKKVEEKYNDAEIR